MLVLIESRSSATMTGLVTFSDDNAGKDFVNCFSFLCTGFFHCIIGNEEAL